MRWIVTSRNNGKDATYLPVERCNIARVEAEGIGTPEISATVYDSEGDDAAYDGQEAQQLLVQLQKIVAADNGAAGLTSPAVVNRA